MQKNKKIHQLDLEKKVSQMDALKDKWTDKQV